MVVATHQLYAKRDAPRSQPQRHLSDRVTSHVEYSRVGEVEGSGQHLHERLAVVGGRGGVGRVDKDSIVPKEKFEVVAEVVTHLQEDRVVRVLVGEELLEDSEQDGRQGVARALAGEPLGQLQERIDLTLEDNFRG